MMPLPSPSQATWPTEVQVRSPTGRADPSATLTASTCDLDSNPAPRVAAQAINLPSGDHDGPSSENVSGALRVASFRSFVPSAPAMTNDITLAMESLRTKAR